MRTTGHGSPWLAAAASSPGYLSSCGWSDLALGYAKALQEEKDITHLLDTTVAMDFLVAKS